MRSKLPLRVKTVADAKVFLQELRNNGEDFHPEDDAFDVIWHTAQPTRKELHRLNKLMTQCFFVDEDFDPCEYLLDLITDDKKLVV